MTFQLRKKEVSMGLASPAEGQCWPNLFFVGVPKAATTSINEMLSLHPQVFCGRIKSPNFMNADIELADVPSIHEISAHGDVHVALVRDEKSYLDLYSGTEGFPVRADCSNDYLRSAISAERIAQKVPDAKIFAVLRNPIERCLSHYLMDLRIGRPVGTFDDEIERHLSLLGRCDFWGGNYIGTGFYDDQLKRYFDRFPRRNILVGIQDDLEADAAAFMARIFDFLGLDPIPLPRKTLSNMARRPRFQNINRWLYTTGVKRWITRNVPQTIKDLSKKRYYTDQVQDRVSDAQYARLADIFRDHTVELSRMLGRDLTPWLSRQKVAPNELKPR